jgi:uncharacterized membrane protein
MHERTAIMSRWLRWWRHRWLDTSDAHDALGAGTLERLQERVRQSELRHTGEIRVCVEAGLPLRDLWRGVSPRERALEVFSELGVWDTEDNNGVLIYLLVADHAIEVVADRGLARHVLPAQWQAVVQAMSGAFKAGRHEEGLNAAVDAVSAWLEQHFPLRDGEANPNQLPDRPVVR